MHSKSSLTDGRTIRLRICAGTCGSSRFTLLVALVILQGCGGDSTPSAITKEQTNDSTPPGSDQDGRFSDLFEVDRSPDPDASNAVLKFRDVAAESGVKFTRFNDAVPKRYFLPEVMGGGAAWFDMDCDGQMDLYATNGRTLWDSQPENSRLVNRLYRNRGNATFRQVTLASSAGDGGYGQGVATTDFNSDGFPDLYVTNYGRNVLLQNNGDGTFQDATATAHVADESWGTSAVWFDANADGLTDLYVVNYLTVAKANHEVCKYGGVPGYCGPGHWDGVADILYLNLGDGRFKSTAVQQPESAKHAKGLAVAACDFDSDGRPEVYVGNDMAPNLLLTRSSTGTSATTELFRNVAGAAGCAVSGEGRNEASMGIACADFDNDGKVDIFLTHYFQHKNTLYRNLDSLLFEDDSKRSKVAAASFQTLGFGTVARDFDLDGDEDLFIANGHVLGPEHSPNAMNPQLMRNDGRGFFDEVSNSGGKYMTQQCVGRGVAGGDFNNDGRTDIAVTHIDRPLAILKNESSATGGFLGLQLSTTNRTPPVGGTITIRMGDTERVVPVVAGGSYLSASDPRIVIGTGDYAGTVDVSISWPGTETESFSGLEANRYWLIRESRDDRIFKPIAMTALTTN